MKAFRCIWEKCKGIRWDGKNSTLHKIFKLLGYDNNTSLYIEDDKLIVMDSSEFDGVLDVLEVGDVLVVREGISEKFNVDSHVITNTVNDGGDVYDVAKLYPITYIGIQYANSYPSGDSIRNFMVSRGAQLPFVGIEDTVIEVEFTWEDPWFSESFSMVPGDYLVYINKSFRVIPSDYKGSGFLMVGKDIPHSDYSAKVTDMYYRVKVGDILRKEEQCQN